MFSKQNSWLFDAVDNSGLVLFRALLGFLLFSEALGALVSGWVTRVFVDTKMTIPFLGFEWLAETLHGPIMYGWYAALCIFGLLVMLGYKYKLSITAYGILWWAVYLSQKSHYNNHYYLMVVMCFVMLLLPAHRYFSIDSFKNANFRKISCPRWCYVLLIGLFWIVYTYASINKIYPDWLQAVPLKIWFKQKSDFWLVGPLLSQEWMPWLIAYGGIVFDGLIIPALLWKKTRWWAFGFNLFFHLFNSAVFHIGVFPYMMIAITVLFFPPTELSKWFFKTKPSLNFLSESFKSKPHIVWALSSFLLLNILFPLRHHLLEGNVLYTEEAHRMSWRMMLRSKGGSISFTVRNQETKEYEIVDLKEYLNRNQISTLATHPDAVYWFIQKLKKEYHNKGWKDLAINVRARVRVNRQDYYYLYETTANLANISWSHLRHNDWVLYPGKVKASH